MPRPHPAWTDLRRNFPQQTTGDVIYALPPGLIEQISVESRNFFTREELRFETALNSTGRTGFFRGRPFAYPLLEEAPPTATEVNDDDRVVEDMLREEVEASSGTGSFGEYQGLRERQAREIWLRQRAFAGWLVTEAGFHVELTAFRRRWNREFERRWPVEIMPASPLGTVEEVRDRDAPFLSAYLLFAQKWNVRKMLTWELPNIINPGLIDPNVVAAHYTGTAGVQLFVPWFMVRDHTITLRDILAAQALTVPLQHLEPWLGKRTKKFGFDRFATMLRLYVYYELALRRRYAEKIERRTAHIDRAFGQFLRNVATRSAQSEAAAETIRRIRLEMQRRLSNCANVLLETELGENA